MIRHSTGTSAPYTVRWYLAILGNIALWAIIAIDAWFLWPTSLGGSTTLVIVNGHSMEPTFSDGDLVIARAGEVSVGDVVVYQPTELGGARVVHRVIGGDGEHGWQVKGDNNSWVDQWSPTDGEVLGSVELHFSGGGRIATLLIQPWLWGFLLFGGALLMLWPGHEETPPSDSTPGRASRADDLVKGRRFTRARA